MYSIQRPTITRSEVRVRQTLREHHRLGRFCKQEIHGLNFNTDYRKQRHRNHGNRLYRRSSMTAAANQIRPSYFMPVGGIDERKIVATVNIHVPPNQENR